MRYESDNHENTKRGCYVLIHYSALKTQGKFVQDIRSNQYTIDTFITLADR